MFLFRALPLLALVFLTALLSSGSPLQPSNAVAAGVPVSEGSVRFGSFASPDPFVPNVSGVQKVVVIRAISADYTGQTPRFNQAQVQSIFDNQLSVLWNKISYGSITISATVTALLQLPGNRSDYLGTSGSSLGNLSLIMNDGVAAAQTAGVSFSGVRAVMVLFAQPVSTPLFFRGVENTEMLAIGPGNSFVATPSAAFSENPTEGLPYVWGRWAHEIGHSFQAGGGPAHPSNYNNEFELMDDLYPGQSGVFEKFTPGGFPGWLPSAKYTTVHITPPGTACGGTAFIAPEEVLPGSVVEAQALRITVTGGLYYLVSVRKRINGDELSPIPDQGVLIERVIVGASQWVTVQGKGGNRDVLWQPGDTFPAVENFFVAVAATVDPNIYRINVTCQSAGQPDAFLTPWLTPPLNTYESTDIWVDSSCNGYGTFQFGSYVPAGDSTAVGQGNGDAPCANHANRVYARIRNIGTQPANGVVVHFDVTDPLGVGMAGASGWANIGTVTPADFPALASIPAGGYADVFVPWNPAIASPPDGDFNWHSCLRVRIAPVTSPSTELNTANNVATENIDQFYSPPAPSGTGSQINKIIHLINDSALQRTFNLYWTSDLPPAWSLAVNSNQTNIVLNPGQVMDIPVTITPGGPRSTGEVYHVHVVTNYGVLLVNSLNPADTHFDHPLQGGVTFEVRVADPTFINVVGTIVPGSPGQPGGFQVNGMLMPPQQGLARPVMVDLRDLQNNVLGSQLVFTLGNGKFSAFFPANPVGPQPYFVSAGFMGEPTVAGSSARSAITPTTYLLPVLVR